MLPAAAVELAAAAVVVAAAAAAVANLEEGEVDQGDMDYEGIY